MLQFTNNVSLLPFYFEIIVVCESSKCLNDELSNFLVPDIDWYWHAGRVGS